ncbi:hypothetical protein GGX14DRAFT_653836 [Mycena pura]|uniref:Uncharacterized protein n=1 Tax=Mycena pura TaxID=153505 RepID=A0AAD6V565_9AGAR|nr:hypothetical protein GGX14DRAFT_653836 [Mycena pura]
MYAGAVAAASSGFANRPPLAVPPSSSTFGGALNIEHALQARCGCCRGRHRQLSPANAVNTTLLRRSALAPASLTTTTVAHALHHPQACAPCGAGFCEHGRCASAKAVSPGRKGNTRGEQDTPSEREKDVKARRSADYSISVVPVTTDGGAAPPPHFILELASPTHGASSVSRHAGAGGQHEPDVRRSLSRWRVVLHKLPNDRAAGVRELFATGVEEDEEDPGTAVEEVGPRIGSAGRKKRLYYDTALGVARVDAFERQDLRGWRAVSCGGRRVLVPSSPWTRRRLRRAIVGSRRGGARA